MNRFFQFAIVAFFASFLAQAQKAPHRQEPLIPPWLSGLWRWALGNGGLGFPMTRKIN